MNKCIVLRFVLLLGITTAIHTNAMEMNNKICYLFLMPFEVLNHIVRFSKRWESQEEFIKRISIEKQVPLEYFDQFITGNRGCLARVDGLKKTIKGVFCPDETKIALFELFCGTCSEPKLMIIDVQKDDKEEAILYEGSLDVRSYRTVGLSRRGEMIALIQKQSTYSNNYSGLVDKDVLVIHKVALLKKLALSKKEESAEEKKLTTIDQTKESLIFPIQDDFVPTNINFNKQGTCVAVHGDNTKSTSAIGKETIIFSLKNKVEGFTLKDAIVAKDNLLQEFFRHNCVCKNILRITYT